MKNLFLIITVIAGLTSSFSFAQNVSIIKNNKIISPAPDIYAKVSSFNGIYKADKTYLQWTVKGQRKSGIYIIQRSKDKETFEIIGNKKGNGVPINDDVLYCFTDNEPLTGVSYYKVSHVTTDGKILTTAIITITSDENLPEVLIADITTN